MISKKGISLLFSISCFMTASAQVKEPLQVKLTGRYYQLIEAPQLADQWENWRNEISV